MSEAISNTMHGGMRPPSSLQVIDLDPNPDGALLSSAAEYNRLFDQDKAAWDSLEEADRAAEEAYGDEADAVGGVWQRMHEDAGRVITLPATTPEGIRAKASVLKRMLLEHYELELEKGSANEEIKVAWSLAMDIVGRPAV
jgi:hypothetical protein